MLSGKKSNDDKNLQELFKEFYAKAKEVNTKEYVNSAKTSINSFSSVLEKKRQQFKDRIKKSDDSAPVQDTEKKATDDSIN